MGKQRFYLDLWDPIFVLVRLNPLLHFLKGISWEVKDKGGVNGNQLFMWQDMISSISINNKPNQ